jgi:LuxR family transcriptional regulator, regulator of acetate metabolism
VTVRHDGRAEGALRAHEGVLAPLRRADAAGQRLFRELVVSRIAWAAVLEAGRLVTADVIALSLRTTGCSHPPPCRLRYCFDRLRVRAMVGNRGPRLPALVLVAGAGAGGAALESGRAVRIDDYAADAVLDDEVREVVVDEEGIGSALGVPLSLGGEVHGVLHVAMRRPGGITDGMAEVLGRLAGYAGAALAAAYDRARVEAIAAARERRRLARELHDELGQVIFGIGISARLARESTSTGGQELVSHLQRLEQQVGRATGVLRGTLKALEGSPTPAEGLAVALREDAAAFTSRTGVPAHLVVLGEPVPLPDAAAGLLLGATREGLRNVERHAHASEVVVTLCFEAGRTEVVVLDDGLGLGDAGEPGTGLARLAGEFAREGGDLRLSGNDDQGATLRASLPILEA